MVINFRCGPVSMKPSEQFNPPTTRFYYPLILQEICKARNIFCGTSADSETSNPLFESKAEFLFTLTKTSCLKWSNGERGCARIISRSESSLPLYREREVNSSWNPRKSTLLVHSQWSNYGGLLSANVYITEIRETLKISSQCPEFLF